MIGNVETVEPGVNSGDWTQAFRPSKKLALIALVLLSGMFAVSVMFAPPAGDYFTVCGFKNLTGLPCPGCGLTHSFCAMGKGQIVAAFGYNLLGPPLFLIFALVWMRSLLVLLNETRPVFAFDQLAERVRLVRRFAIAFIIFGVARVLYVLLFQPEPLRASPLMKWLSTLFG
ncbi:MAG TPA: DUF2752 domain-containing protein [Blastocatellia bacterium]|nr:DUF2752 domain-containing protein [Blastocatellia bacterium]